MYIVGFQVFIKNQISSTQILIKEWLLFYKTNCGTKKNLYISKKIGAMSKKKKVSSPKSKGKSVAKPAKKKVVKKTKTAPKKKIAKPKKVKAISKAKPSPKAKAVKKTSKPTAKKTTITAPKQNTGYIKDAKNKTIVKGSIKEYSKPVDTIINPVLLKNEDKPIPEFKPIIKPSVKEASKNKDNFPQAIKSTSAASFVSTPAKKTEAYSVKPEKEPAGKFEIEIVIRASAELLYEFFVTPSGLSEWFCDDVNIRNGIYTFVWDGQLQQARLLKTIEEHLVRYQWVEKTDGSYFEFKIQKDDLTNDISLIITDFANDKSDQESAKLLWQSQVDKLLHVMGSYF